MNEREQIECGKCRSKYYPRIIEKLTLGVTEKDYSCPVCSYGKTQESFEPKGKKILQG